MPATTKSRAPAPAAPPALNNPSGGPAKKTKLDGNDCVIDLKGLSHIPGNLDEEPLRSQRLLVFARGSTVHVPKVPGAYTTTKPFSVVMAPCMASFKESSGLPDQLVLSFTDHSLASATMAGIGIVTLDFPLKIKNNTWKGETEAQIKNLNVVDAFYPIDTSDLKYIDVNPTLKHFPPLSKLSIHAPPDALTWITKKLEEKLAMLLKQALEEAKTYAELVRITDERAANNLLAQHTAQLEKLKLDLEAIGLHHYDLRITERIKVIDLDDSTTSASLEWLTSPIRGSLRQGAAVRRDTSLKVRRSRIIVDVAEVQPSPLPPVQEEVAMEKEASGADKTPNADDNDDGEDDEEDSEEEEQEEYELLKSRRDRKRTERFEAGAVPQGKKRVKKVEEKARGSTKSTKEKVIKEGSRIGTANPRGGIYKRDAYNHSGDSAFVSAIRSGDNKKQEAGEKAVAKMQTELAALAGKLADAVAKMAEESAARKEAEAKALAAEQHLQDAVALAVKDEKITNITENHAQFMKGMAHGAAMARGDMSVLMPARNLSVPGSAVAESPAGPFATFGAFSGGSGA